MKQKPDFKEIQDLMAPGKLTIDGFLGGDNRSLVDILAADDLVVRSRGFDHKTIAARLTQFMNEGRKGLGNPVKFRGDFIITVDESRGVVPCPFRHGYLASKVNVRIEDVVLGETLVYSDLSIHLIAAHGFYQGKGSQYRLDPEKVLRVLRMEEQNGD